MKRFIYNNKKIIILVSFIIFIIFLIIIKISIYKDNNVYVDIDEDRDVELNEKENNNKDNELFYVDIKGAVVNPGVYALDSNKRIIDAIKMAGGFLDNSDTSLINLSKYIEDEMVIVVYTREELESNNNIDYSFNDAYYDVGSSNNIDKVLININVASFDELISLSGIGEVKARAIIAYREENGKFNNIEDIKNVSGIGNSVYEKIKDFITV